MPPATCQRGHAHDSIVAAAACNLEPGYKFAQQRRVVLQWRGPFSVIRVGREYRIINAARELERSGFRMKGAADELCRLMNLAKEHCNEIEVPNAR